MAEIRVERKGGVPWWIYLVGILALLTLLLFGMRACATPRAAARNPGDGPARITAEGVGTATGARVTDVNVFGSTVDKKSLIGRGVDLQHVTVARVVSDRVFTGTAGTAEMFVMLDDRLNTGAAEAAIKARPGQMVSLRGSFRIVPDRETTDEQGRGLNPQEYAQMKGPQIYLHATAARNTQ